MDDETKDSRRPEDDERPPIENSAGEPIETPEQWRDRAAPASPLHWKEDRSALEFARAWTEGDAASRLRALLQTHSELAGVHLDRAIAERKTRFDDIGGGPRNHDLLIPASLPGGAWSSASRPRSTRASTASSPTTARRLCAVIRARGRPSGSTA
jgi:hypothetical protein